MNGILFTAFKILGMLFSICELINLAAHLSGSDEVHSVMGKSLSIRTGIFSTK